MVAHGQACGETRVHNIDGGFITKSQVYEYFASFNYDKAFESVFGRVACLPGCLTMFSASMMRSPQFYLEVVRKFAARPDASSLVSHICKEKGEDRYVREVAWIWVTRVCFFSLCGVAHAAG